MIKRYLIGFREWAKLGWTVFLAMLCSIINVFVDSVPLSRVLDVAYIALMIMYIVKLVRHTKEMRVLRDKTIWTSLFMASTLSSSMGMRFLVPSIPKSRIKRLWRRLRKQTELKLFEGRMDARSGVYPYREDPASMYSSVQRVVVDQDKFFKMKLSGLIETSDLDKLKKFLKETKTNVPVGFFD